MAASSLAVMTRQIQNLGMNIEDQGHPADYVKVNIKKLKKALTNLPRRLSLTPSSVMLILVTPTLNQYLPK